MPGTKWKFTKATCEKPSKFLTVQRITIRPNNQKSPPGKPRERTPIKDTSDTKCTPVPIKSQAEPAGNQNKKNPTGRATTPNCKRIVSIVAAVCGIILLIVSIICCCCCCGSKSSYAQKPYHPNPAHPYAVPEHPLARFRRLQRQRKMTMRYGPACR